MSSKKSAGAKKGEQSPIITKVGDGGFSILANGERLPKDDLVFEVLGELDELNSYLGWCINIFKEEKGLQVLALHETADVQLQLLYKIQGELFWLGAFFAKAQKFKFDQSLVEILETAAKKLHKEVPNEWLSKFLLPGGSQIAASLDIARTVCRRLERHMVAYKNEQSGNWQEKNLHVFEQMIFPAINRLADYLYILRCWCNGVLDVPERPFN